MDPRTRSPRRSPNSGVRRGDRVALLLPNCPQFLIAEMAAWRLGAVVVPLNPIYSEEELHGPLVLTGSETVVVLTPFYERIRAAVKGTAVKRIVATNIKEYLPPLLRVLFTLFKEKKDGHRVTLHAGDLRLDELLAAHRGAAAPPSSRGRAMSRRCSSPAAPPACPSAPRPRTPSTSRPDCRCGPGSAATCRNGSRRS